MLHAQAKANRIADAVPQASVRGFQIPVCAPTMSFICVDTCVQRRCVFRKLDDNDGDHYVGAAPVSVKVSQLVGGNCVLLMNPVAHHVVFVLRIIELILDQGVRVRTLTRSRDAEDPFGGRVEVAP